MKKTTNRKRATAKPATLTDAARDGLLDLLLALEDAAAAAGRLLAEGCPIDRRHLLAARYQAEAIGDAIWVEAPTAVTQALEVRRGTPYGQWIAAREKGEQPTAEQVEALKSWLAGADVAA